MIIAPALEQEHEVEYQYQVVEVQDSEVGLMVGLTQRYDCKADALYMLDLIRKQREEYWQGNERGFSVAVKITVKCEEE